MGENVDTNCTLSVEFFQSGSLIFRVVREDCGWIDKNRGLRIGNFQIAIGGIIIDQTKLKSAASGAQSLVLNSNMILSVGIIGDSTNLIETDQLHFYLFYNPYFNRLHLRNFIRH